MNCEHASTDLRRTTTANLPKQQFPGALPEWDSLARFNTFLLIEQTYGKFFFARKAAPNVSDDHAFLEPADVDDALVVCGIEAGDVLFVHSDAIVTEQFPTSAPEERCDMLIDAILARLGDSGNLVMPTFTNGFTRSVAFAGAQVMFIRTPKRFICGLIEAREAIA